jgi:bifunctional ADP-heptose synthase (sugar kinase/adenylyltransferase)
VETDKLPAFNPNPVDVAGAGDSMLAVASLSFAARASIWQSAYLASLASAIQVSRQGNIPMDVFDLENMVNTIEVGNK